MKKISHTISIRQIAATANTLKALTITIQNICHGRFWLQFFVLLQIYCLSPINIFANVTISTGGVASSSYTLSNLTYPSYTALGTIAIMENASNDISQAGGTLVLNCPAGFEFLAGAGSAYSTLAPDIISANISTVSTSQITITIAGNGGGTACCDQITITGIFVRAAALCPVAVNGIITKDASGSQTVTGVVNGVTSFGTLSQASTSLATNTITGSPLCQGATVSVPFTACGFAAGNIFTAELSDAAGSFAAPVAIGTLAATSSGTISATLPGTITAGSGYRIRVSASNPAITGSDNGINLTIVSPISTGVISYAPACPGGSIMVPYTVNGSCTAFNAGNIFTAQLSDANGSFATPVNIGSVASTSGGTINAVIPGGISTGTGYRIRVVSSNPSFTGTTNSSTATVTKNLYASHLNWQILWSSGDQFDAGDIGCTVQFGAAPPSGQNDIITTAYWPLTSTSCGTSFGSGTYITFGATQARIVNFNGPAAFTIAPLATLPLSTSTVCNGSTVNVKYSVPASCNTFSAGNVFTAELSDATGSFATPTVIGSLSSTASGTIVATLPSSTPIGSGYRIRVKSSSPAITGNDNGTDLSNQSITATVTGSPFCANSSIGVSYVVACTSSLNAGNIFTVELSNPSGGFTSGVTVLGTLTSTAGSGTILASIPSGAVASGYYRVRIKSSAVAFTGTDNGSDITITAPCNSASTSFIQTIGEANQSAIYSVQLTPAGGYTVLGNAGSSNTNPGDYYPSVVYLNTADIFLTNVNPDGSILWQKSYGVMQYNAYYHVLRHENTADGGFIIAGGVDNGCSPSGSSCYTRPMLIKTTSDGTIQWSKTYDCYASIFAWGGWAFSVKQTTDGGYIVYGPQMEGYTVPYLMKLDANGNVTWKYSYGSNGGAICCTEEARAVRQTSDGGYALLSPGGDYNMGGSFDLIKVNASGAVQWSNSFHYGTGTGGGYDLQTTTDGGFIMTGNSTTNGIFLVRANASGAALWGKTFSYNGGMSNAVCQTSDGGFVITGTSNGDIILIKTNSTGSLLWAKAFNPGTTDRGMDVKQTADGGYVIAGYTGSFGNKGILIKTDVNGNSVCCGTDITSLITTGSGVTTGSIAYGTTATALPTGAAALSIGTGGTVTANIICSSLTTSLPVELISFHAKLLSNKTVLASWSTASEMNNDYFIVERSADAETFDSVGNVEGAGISLQQHDYSLVDEKPCSGISYYRLKQIDFDRTVTYSNIVAVKNFEPFYVNVYPNPASSVLYYDVFFEEDENITVQVTDMAGRILISQQQLMFKGNSGGTVDISSLTHGIYFFSINAPPTNYQARFIKQ
ncbi:MAG: T9SS type A sorting domain-containing protein [Chitinophagales bacterium]|nr:T9SS type A sorting domain-containing protein [Chitinophagales bacterium]